MVIPKEIRPLGEYDKWMRMLLVADSGFGKTVFGGTAPNALFLTTDKEGTVSAKVLGSKAREWKIHDHNEMLKAYRYLRDGGIKELGLEFLVIDNASETQTLGMEATMALARSKKKDLDEFIPTQQDYQRSQNMFLAMVKQFNDLPVHIIWTSWQKIEEDHEGEIFYAPGIHGQQGMLAQTVAGYMNIVGYGEVIEDDNGKEHRRIWFTHHGPFRGKDRFNVLGKYRTDMDVPKMMALVEGAGKKTSTSTPTRKPVARKAPATPRKKA